MEIRPYQPQDGPVLAALFYQTVHTVNAADYTPQQLSAWAPGQMDLAAWNRSLLAHDTLVAVVDTGIAAFADMDETGYLDRLYVHRDHQRRGLATALCDLLEGRRAGPYTTHASITACPFFLRRGYQIIKKERVERQGVQLERFWMEKRCF